MAKNIKDVFDTACASLKIDAKLLKEIHAYGGAFVNKNDDHVRGFGSNLLGVYPVRFIPADKFAWNIDILGIEESDVRREVISLPTVNEAWVRGTDVMNLSCLWLAHKIFNTDLPPKVKEQGMIDTLMVLHYKMFSSLAAHFFKYPADEATALACYASLSKKFAVKQYGSWGKVLEARSHDIVSPKSIHYGTLQRFNDDAAIQYMVTDIQGRLRSQYKNIWFEFDKIRTSDSKFLKTGSTIELDGKIHIRDVERSYTPYKRYLHEISGDLGRFIKAELVGVIASAMPTMSDKLLYDALAHVVAGVNKHDKKVTELLEETVLHAFGYLAEDREARARLTDLSFILTRLRALYMASRSSDPTLMKMRDVGEDVVKKAVHSTNPSVIASVRTGLLLYIVLRTFSMKHYG